MKSSQLQTKMLLLNRRAMETTIIATLLVTASVWSCIIPGAAAQMGTNQTLPAQSDVISITTAASDALRGYYSIPRSFINTVLPDPTPYGKHVSTVCEMNCIFLQV